MSSFVHVIGHLGQDAELTYLDTGLARVNFRVASNDWRDKDETATWFACTMWGSRAEKLNEYLLKGTQLSIHGPLRHRAYEHKGESRYSLDVDVKELELLGGKGNADSGGTAPAQKGYTDRRGRGQPASRPVRSRAPARPAVVDDGEIPF